MKNILENVIRTFLFESQTVGKIKSVSQKDLTIAKAAGALWAYAVLVRGTTNTDAILNLVEGATLASVSTDSESRVIVGKTSKFANGEYMYVVADPKPLNRQLLLVRIMPKLIEPKTDQQTDVEMTSFAKHRINRSLMMTETTYNSLVKQYKEMGNTEYTELAEIPIEEVPNIDSESQPETQQESGYPFKWNTANGNFMVYSMSLTDKFIYVKGEDVWYASLKTDFEANYKDPIAAYKLMKPANATVSDKLENIFSTN